MLGIFFEDDEYVKNEKDKILKDEESGIEAEEEILKDKKKNIKSMKEQIKEDENLEVSELEPDEDEEILIEKDPENELDDIDDEDIDFEKLEEGLEIIEKNAKKYGILDDETEENTIEVGKKNIDEKDENLYDPQEITETRNPYVRKDEDLKKIKLGQKAKDDWLVSKTAIAYARSANDEDYLTLAKAERERNKAVDNIRKKYKRRSERTVQKMKDKNKEDQDDI